MKNNIRKYRMKKGLSIENLARLVGVCYMTMHCYETGKSNPSANNAIKIAEVLGVTVEELMEEDDNG